MERSFLKRWIFVAGASALLYAVAGQAWLWIVYRFEGVLAGNDVRDRSATFAIVLASVFAATSLLVALERDDRAARRAAYAATLGLLGGVALHLLLRASLWPSLEEGCWVHRGPGAFADLLCYDVVPPVGGDVRGFLLSFLIPLVSSAMAFSFLLGAVVLGLRGLRTRKVLS